MWPFLGIAVTEEIPEALLNQLTGLAQQLERPLLDSEQGFFSACDASLALVYAGGRLELRYYGPGNYGAVYADPDNPDIRRRIQAGKRQPFARAFGLHRHQDLRVLDATAGLGRDSLVLAGLGCQVSLLERHPITHVLLADALRRAQASRRGPLELLPCEEAQHYLDRTQQDFDVIYLDPMYPQEGRRALPKKNMQLLRELAGADSDADSLLVRALGAARRVVVKRAPHAADLAGRAPAHRITANRVRYDVYLN